MLLEGKGPDQWFGKMVSGRLEEGPLWETGFYRYILRVKTEGAF